MNCVRMKVVTTSSAWFVTMYLNFTIPRSGFEANGFNSTTSATTLIGLPKN